MTCNVAFMWELGWNTPIKEAELWTHPLRSFGADNVYATPVSGIKTKNIIEFDYLQEILDQNKDNKVVWVDETGEEPLCEFEHPEDALYIFGKTNWRPYLTMAQKDDLSVCLETMTGAGLRWEHQAASVVLYDRKIKRMGKRIIL